MVTIAQRIEQLRTERNLTRPALAAALGLPRTTIEKFETGRITPSQAQQDKLAQYFGVTLAVLQGKDDNMSAWMEGAYMDEPTTTASAPVSRPKKAVQHTADSGNGSMMDALLASSKFKEALREAALDVLRTQEGQDILANVVRRELMKRGK